jgi:hypothetical protein
MASRWTQKEIDFLKENYLNMSHTQLSEHLNRTFSAIHSMMVELKLHRRNDNRKLYLQENKRRCNKCKKMIALSDFYIRNQNNRSYRHVCKKCQKKIADAYRPKYRLRHNELSRKYYQKLSVEKRKSINKINNQKLLRERTNLLIQIKKDFGGCCHCGESRIECLIFHHINPKNKKSCISTLRTVRKILKEIDKCTIVCSNCHLLHHYGNMKLNNVRPIDISKYQTIKSINSHDGYRTE